MQVGHAGINRSERIGRYEVLRKIATGGMAELFLARQVGMEGFEKVVAIKRILAHLAYDEEFINMFRDEARLVAKLSHPNIVQIYDLAKSDDTYFIAMEYIPGRNLSSVAKKCRARSVVFPPEYIARCVAQACEGLYYAHTRKDVDGQPLQIVHRDVSPQNVILSFSGSVKLVDFGIAKAATKIAHTRAGVLKGKYAYMSPEQIRGEVIDARSDLFAVGIVLYELLCGRRPFEKDNSIQTLKAIVQDPHIDCRLLNPRIPDALAEIIDRALVKDPRRRFQSAQEIQIALEDFVTNTGIRCNNITISRWVTDLFSEELSKERGGTVLLPGLGEVILPEIEKAQAPDESSLVRTNETPDLISDDVSAAIRAPRAPIPAPSTLRAGLGAEVSRDFIARPAEPTLASRGRGSGGWEEDQTVLADDDPADPPLPNTIDPNRIYPDDDTLFSPRQEEPDDKDLFVRSVSNDPPAATVDMGGSSNDIELWAEQTLAQPSDHDAPELGEPEPVRMPVLGRVENSPGTRATSQGPKANDRGPSDGRPSGDWGDLTDFDDEASFASEAGTWSEATADADYLQDKVKSPVVADFSEAPHLTGRRPLNADEFARVPSASRPDEHLVRADGQLITADGHLLSVDGQLLVADGHLLTADGHPITTNGHPVALDGHRITPDGHRNAPHSSAPAWAKEVLPSTDRNPEGLDTEDSFSHWQNPSQKETQSDGSALEIDEQAAHSSSNGEVGAHDEDHLEIALDAARDTNTETASAFFEPHLGVEIPIEIERSSSSHSGMDPPTDSDRQRAPALDDADDDELDETMRGEARPPLHALEDILNDEVNRASSLQEISLPSTPLVKEEFPPQRDPASGLRPGLGLGHAGLPTIGMDSRSSPIGSTNVPPAALSLSDVLANPAPRGPRSSLEVFGSEDSHNTSSASNWANTPSRSSGTPTGSKTPSSKTPSGSQPDRFLRPQSILPRAATTNARPSGAQPRTPSLIGRQIREAVRSTSVAELSATSPSKGSLTAPPALDLSDLAGGTPEAAVPALPAAPMAPPTPPAAPIRRRTLPGAVLTFAGVAVFAMGMFALLWFVFPEVFGVRGPALRLETTPPGARVIVNGQLQKSLTPVTLTGLTPGVQYAVELQLDGYEAVSRTVELREDKPIFVAVPLNPILGSPRASPPTGPAHPTKAP